MRRNATLTIAVILSVSCSVLAQTPAPTADERYYDFWIGSWHRVEAGTREAEPSFIVARGVHASAFEESWRLRGDNGEALVSRGIRAWDSATKRWMFAWISAEGLFQVWEGRKVGADWYIYREFEQQGRKFWSRQAWLRMDATHVTRVMERSFDGGSTWETRSRTPFRKAQ